MKKIFNHYISPIRWVNIFFILLSIITISIFSFNKIIDPYGQQNNFCELKYKPVINERAKKYNYIFYEEHFNDYDCIILGSSRVMKIEPANNKSIKKCFNFGVHVANNAEKLFILEEWLKKKKLNTVYLGIDYYNFHKRKQPLFVNINDYKGTSSSNYLSLSTLKLSYKSLINRLNNKPQTYFNKDGSINYYNKEILISKNKYDFSKKKFAQESKRYILNNMIQSPFYIENKVFDTLHKINILSKKHNFKLFVFLTPMQNEMNIELKNNPEIIQKFEIIKKKLVTEFGYIYDFSEKNKCNKNRQNFYDPFHYRAMLGEKIILRLNSLNSSYGNKLITKPYIKQPLEGLK